MLRKGRILVVDDERDIRTLIRDILEDEGYDVAESPHSESAYAYIAAQGMPDLVVLDIWLENSDRDGMEILADLKKRDAALPVLMISGHGNIEMAVNAIKLGAYDFIEKPFNTDRLLHLVERAIESGRLRRQGGRARITLQSDVAEMQAAIKLAAKAAQGDGRIIITGAAGSGRNHLAAWIHQESGRGSLPFVSVAASGLDDGALARAISRAGAGTFVLRDVTALPADTQKALLKHVAAKTECRIIVTADPGFGAASLNGFLPDLYERLAVNAIDVPGLNVRRGDICALAIAFVREAFEKWGQGGEVTLADDALSLLQNRRWHGHMSELQVLCAMAAFRMMQDGAKVLSARHFEGEGAGTADAAQNPAGSWLSLDLRGARAAFERWYFENMLARFDGNISQMAAFVGMDRTALHRKLKSLKDDEGKAGGDGDERLAS